MRELNQQEIEAVGGAGLIADAAALLGRGIGTVVDLGLNIFSLDKNNQAAAGSETLARGIGMLIEAKLTIISNIFNGIFKRG